jgi:hypothetical protein
MRHGELISAYFASMQLVIFGTSGMKSRQRRIASGVQAWRVSAATCAPSLSCAMTLPAKLTRNITDAPKGNTRRSKKPVLLMRRPRQAIPRMTSKNAQGRRMAASSCVQISKLCEATAHNFHGRKRDRLCCAAEEDERRTRRISSSPCGSEDSWRRSNRSRRHGAASWSLASAP